MKTKLYLEQKIVSIQLDRLFVRVGKLNETFNLNLMGNLIWFLLITGYAERKCIRSDHTTARRALTKKASVRCAARNSSTRKTTNRAPHKPNEIYLSNNAKAKRKSQPLFGTINRFNAALSQRLRPSFRDRFVVQWDVSRTNLGLNVN